MREHGTRKLIFEERCTILFDNVVARWSPGVDHMLRSECDLVPLAQRQVLGNARITVENSEITRFRPGLDDHPHSINPAIDDAAVLLRFNVE